MWYLQWRGEVHIGFLWENLSEIDHLENQNVDISIILKWYFKK